ncbi:hypothetical protein BAU07_26050 (plasmid) [Bordetella flabilis]|uniref:Uncharacterized protein n=1 Tax=Bordetella flabilis TaxID=463014 RepID=A0A193GMH0_9BORD|nr:hypothetical protein BAU07_26050 [Bordetella flabilis]
MKLKYLFVTLALLTFIASVRWFLAQDEFVASLFLMMGLACLLNAARPEANKPVKVKDLIALVQPPK